MLIHEIIRRLEGLQRYDHDGIHGVCPHRDGDLVDWEDIKNLIDELRRVPVGGTDSSGYKGGHNV